MKSVVLCDQTNKYYCRFNLERMVQEYLQQAIRYITNVDKEDKLLDLNYDEGDICKSFMNMNPIFIKPKTGTPNIIEMIL